MVLAIIEAYGVRADESGRSRGTGVGVVDGTNRERQHLSK